MAVASKQAQRLSRAERTERNRERVLAAAREVFLSRGYHGATVDQIAAAAGFSTGVVYSQFGAKADLFLALLEGRIEERIRDNAALAASLDGREGLVRLVEHTAQVTFAEPEWGLLVLEFRVHAARDPELNARYARAHARTVSGLADVLARSRTNGGLAPEELAEVVAAISSGSQLELAAGRDAFTGPLLRKVIERLAT
jgi:AcrR family transcriptional regulator